MPRPLRDVTFAILDTETTGLSPARGARLCELAILFVKDGKTVDKFETLIDPGVPIEWGAQRVHGISDDMVAGKPAFRDIAEEVGGILKGKVIVCHNMPFDRSFMRAEFEIAGVPMPRMPEICTLKLARRHFHFRKNGLGHIVDVELDAEYKKKKGLTVVGSHRALHDVRMLKGVFEYLLEKLRIKRNVESLEDLLALVKA